MTDAEDLKDNAEDLADLIQAEPTEFGLRGVYAPKDLLRSDVWLYGTGRDHEAAQKAVALLLGRFDFPLAVKKLIVAFDRSEHSTWVILVRTVGKRIISDAKMKQLKEEGGRADLAASKPE